MPGIDDKVKENSTKIGVLEGEVGNLKVETGKLALTLDHQEDRQQERFKVLSTAQMDLKDIMRARAAADEKRADEARSYRAEREKQETAASLAKQKWIQSLLTPQTLVIILVIIAAAFGVKGMDFMSSAVMETAPAPESP